ncbi:hypothetical protein [Escherichia coli]|nr:hypothetical protein [Escherichia coli]
MPSMIAIILLIILHIWLCRQGGDHFWSKSRLNISMFLTCFAHLGLSCKIVTNSHIIDN